MRIWYQSSTSMGSDPKWVPYQESLKRHVQKVARPDTSVEVHGVKVSHPLMERSGYAKYLNQGQIIDNAITAEREGYDVFCVGCTLDPGYYEVREVVSIPVAFLAESCFHLASILADKFSLLAHGERTYIALRQKMRHYGVEERFIPSRVFSISMPDLINGFGNPKPVIDVVEEAGREAAGNGVGMFVPACNILNMVLVDAGLREIDGVPILDTAGALVKVAELMFDLKEIGVSRSKTGPFTPLQGEELVSIREVYSGTKA